MRGTGERWEKITRRCFQRGTAATTMRRGLWGAGLALLLGGALGLGIAGRRHPATLHTMKVRAALPAAPRTPFEVSFAEAQGWYVRAQVKAKGQLESLEEWDPAGMRGRAPEIYRRRVIARTGEIVRAEAAARAARRQARAGEERYRATRLLVHPERDMGCVSAERAAARQLLALRPRASEAALLLEAAEAEQPPGAAPAYRAGK